MKAWIWKQRASVRLGFMLQIGCRVLTALLALVWAPLLLRSMGTALNGVFLTFQSIATLGGLGDLGMGGVVGIQTSRLLGQRREAELADFLSGARALFAALAVWLTVLFVASAPWLPALLHLPGTAATGSMTLLFALGGLGAGLLIVSSYFVNLNLGCNNLTWAVVPGFLILQGSLAGHWLLARAQAPLWIQFVPYLIASALGVGLGWMMVRASHPALAAILPLRFEGGRFRTMLGESLWVYLYCVGGGVYVATDRILLNVGFGAEAVPAYQYNYKLCELALFVISSANMIGMPKITQWLASPVDADRSRAIHESERLNRFQTLLGCGGALFILGVNDEFMRRWLGAEFQVPLLLQAAFAANMAVTAAGLVGYELCPRYSSQGLRFGGLIVGAAALLNLGLSYLSLKLGSMVGIALATVAAQSLQMLGSAWYPCRELRLSLWRLAVKPWALSLAVVAAGYAVRRVVPMDSAANVLLVVAVFSAFLAAVAGVLGLRRRDWQHELAQVRALFRR